MCNNENANPHVWALFRETGRFVHAWHNITPCKELSRVQFHTLALVHRMLNGGSFPNGVTVSDLANELHVSMPAVSQNVSALVDLGMLARINHKKDRRMTYLQPTEQGAAVMKEAMMLLLEKLTVALQGEDLEAMTNMMAALTAAMRSIADETMEENAKC